MATKAERRVGSEISQLGVFKGWKAEAAAAQLSTG
jgi:hypothetical protein